jgi:hypothetical protein
MKSLESKPLIEVLNEFVILKIIQNDILLQNLIIFTFYKK